MVNGYIKDVNLEMLLNQLLVITNGLLLVLCSSAGSYTKNVIELKTCSDFSQTGNYWWDTFIRLIQSYYSFTSESFSLFYSFNLS